MGENIMTVDDVLSLFKKLSEQGKGNMKIKCMDNYLHEDEITINYLTNELLFRGYLFNVPITDKVKQFCDDIEKAMKKFYTGKDYE